MWTNRCAKTGEMWQCKTKTVVITRRCWCQCNIKKDRKVAMNVTITKVTTGVVLKRHIGHMRQYKVKQIYKKWTDCCEKYKRNVTTHDTTWQQ